MTADLLHNSHECFANLFARLDLGDSDLDDKYSDPDPDTRTLELSKFRILTPIRRRTAPQMRAVI